MRMDNKFYRKDISEFDPTNASAEDIRKWLFAIIDAELEKDPEERDCDLIEECSEFEAELPEMGVEMSEDEYAAGLERIKARASAGEQKETKTLENKKKSKKSIRLIVILAAALAFVLSSVAGASMHEGSLNPILADNIFKIFEMQPGDSFEFDNQTITKTEMIFESSSIEEVVSFVGWDMLYPTYLPEGVDIDTVAVHNEDGKGGLAVVYVMNEEYIFISANNYLKNNFSEWHDAVLYKTDVADFYVIPKIGISCQAMTTYKGIRYFINFHYTDYDELIKVIEGFKEVKK